MIFFSYLKGALGGASIKEKSLHNIFSFLPLFDLQPQKPFHKWFCHISAALSAEVIKKNNKKDEVKGILSFTFTMLRFLRGVFQNYRKDLKEC